MADICKVCGMEEKDGDSHFQTSVRDDGALVIRCLFNATLGREWTAMYGRTEPMPNQRIYFTALSDPDTWD